VLTNNHLIEDATSISIVDVGNRKTYAATVEGYDPSDDIAVLALQKASRLATVRLADPSAVAIGHQVVAVGNGGAGSAPSLASGTITGVDQSITATDQSTGTSDQLTGLIETNAPIQSADSGGPLVTNSGTVIGMTTATTSSYSFSGAASQGYAIPTNIAQSIAAQITSGQGSSTIHVGPTPFLGVQVTTSPTFGGTQTAVVVGVQPGSPAQSAGIGVGDTITSLDGQSTDITDQLTEMLVAYQPGDIIQLGWQNASGQTHSASVTLTTGPPA
jgi:S1-C subfamily serine protease